MAVVKRFRTLGQIRQVDPAHLATSSDSVVKSDPVLVKDISLDSVSSRRRYSSKKHQYPLRSTLTLWGKITDLNLNCQGLESGPSLNETLCDLIEMALADDVIVNWIMNKYPDRNQIVLVRSWESV